MKSYTPWPGLVVLCVLVSQAAGDPPAKRDADYSELSKIIQKAVVSRLPKKFEDDSTWGQTIPIPDNLRRPRLRRTVVKVGDHDELPQGNWRKVRAWLPDPNKDLVVKVRDLKKVDADTYRLVVDADVKLRTETDMQQWRKGLLLLDTTVKADAAVRLALEFDVKVKLVEPLPPKFKIEPKVTGLKMDLQDFDLKSVTLNRTGVELEGEAAQKAGESIKGALQGMMRAAEPQVKERANDAIARSLREGRGTVSLMDLMQADGKK
jgi:hypothetical protein